MSRTYSELITIPSFEERFEYLRIDGRVGEDTFGFDRYLNQIFYKTKEWRSIRNFVITRDLGHDMAMPEDIFEIQGKVLVHHMNPIRKEDILYRKPDILNPEYLVCVSKKTHDAIHYGFEPPKDFFIVERFANDTCPWKL